MWRTKMTALALAVLTLCAVGYAAAGNPVVALHNGRLKKAISEAGDRETVMLNELIPFDWDCVYTFSPYTGREEIARIIGFDSVSIKENNVDEGMVHLLFVKDKKVTASILGHGEVLGYRIEFPSVVTFAENALFHVSRANGVVTLTYAE